MGDHFVDTFERIKYCFILHFRKSGNSLYELLGIEKGSTHDDIKKAYRRVSYHNHNLHFEN